MTIDIGSYNRRNVAAFLGDRPDVYNPSKLAAHLAATGPESPDAFIGKEHVMLFAILSGAYTQASRPYPFIIAGLVGLDRTNPPIFNRNEVDFPEVPRGTLESTAYASVNLDRRLTRFLELTQFCPLQPFDHVFRTSDLARLTDPEHYRTGRALLNVLHLPTRQKLETMADFVLNQVIPYYNS